MKALVISNPPEGDAERQLLHDTLNRHFAAAHIEYEIYETREGGRLADIVREHLSDGFDLVVAAGGDGTVSAVGDGLAESTIPLGIIPSGTGNLIARELEIPEDLEAAVALIAGAHRERKIDGMRIGKRIFFLNASVGISAAVAGGTTRGSKRRFGRIAYVGTTILKVLSSKPRYLVVEVDGKAHPYRAVDVAIMNCGMIGRQLYPGDTDIHIDDGHLGVGILSVKRIWHCSWYAIGVVVGWLVTPRSHFIKVDQAVNIRSNVPLPVQADGDLIGTTPIHVEVLPGALTVLVPA
jgi:diacylglycerol kinase (ATP)